MSVRVLPEEIAELIDDALPSEDAATDDQVAKFLAEHTKSSRPNLILGRVKMLKDKYAAGESRHGSTTPVVKGGFAEARAGYHPAQLVIDTLKPIFLEAVAKSPIGNKQGNARNGAVAESEWDGIVAWAIAQAKADDLDEIRARIDEKMPEQSFHTAQLGFAYQLAEVCRGWLLYVYGLGWHYWDGKRWAFDDIGAAQRAVYKLFERLWPEAFSDKELARSISRCETATGVTGILALARALPEFAATVRDLDADPYLLNVANGTLDLHTMQLSPHNPADRITKVTRAAYDPHAPGSRWAAFLCRVLPDEPVRAYLQRVVGVGLLGKVIDHVLAILTGTGANGKGTFSKAICWTLGDYASTVEPDLLMHRQGAHPTGEMDLLGRRLVVVSESERDRRLAEATMKRLTGGDVIRARKMRQDFVEFAPSHTPLLITNHLPKVAGDDPAIWRRLRVVPFTVEIPPDERNPHLDELLQAEADAVLSWAVAGWATYQQGGLAEPAAVLSATDAYQHSSDAVGRFVGEKCVTSSSALKATTSQLFEVWEKWRADDGAEAMSLKAFGQALDRLGYRAEAPVSGKRWRPGIGVPVEVDNAD